MFTARIDPAAETMRIIAGRWRSRKLVRPKTTQTRPMPDQVKEAVFNILGSHFGTSGALPPLVVADVFAGSGSMGLEALSRGAARCCFFERDRVALEALRINTESIGVKEMVTVIKGDAWHTATSAHTGDAFDLVFLDPPYRDSMEPGRDGKVQRYLDRLVKSGANAPLVVLHHVSTAEFCEPLVEPWNISLQKKFGSGAITVFDT